MARLGSLTVAWAMALAGGCGGPGAAAGAAAFVCIGTEPFWWLDLGEERARYEPMEGARATFAGRLAGVANRSDAFAWRGGPAGGEGRGDLVAFLRRTEACSDGMSDRVYPFEVFVALPDGTALQGCCRTPDEGEEGAAAPPQEGDGDAR